MLTQPAVHIGLQGGRYCFPENVKIPHLNLTAYSIQRQGVWFVSIRLFALPTGRGSGGGVVVVIFSIFFAGCACEVARGWSEAPSTKTNHNNAGDGMQGKGDEGRFSIYRATSSIPKNAYAITRVNNGVYLGGGGGVQMESAFLRKP
jgi:hypothetical protein